MVENKSEIEIKPAREWTRIADNGRFKQVLEVPYVINGIEHKVEIDKDQATEETIENLVRADAKKFIGTANKKITL